MTKAAGTDEGTEAAGPGRSGADPAETAGRKAERLVYDRVRSALPERVVVLPNVRWIARDRGHEIEGEADLVIADPDRGFLVLEVKAGEIRRDDHGRWWAGKHRLDPVAVRAGLGESPQPRQEAARAARLGVGPQAHGRPGRRVSRRRSRQCRRSAGPRRARAGRGPGSHPGPASTPARRRPRRRPSSLARPGLRALAPRGWRHRIGHATAGREGRGHPAGPRHVARRAAFDAAQRAGRRRAGGRPADRRPDRRRSTRSAACAGRASSGAPGPARRCWPSRRPAGSPAKGFRTLLVCFNSPLARMLAAETDETAASTGLLTVSTFHQLCEDLGREAGTLPPKPANPVPPSWFNETLPDALEAAIERDGGRFHAIVVDEGQDFEDRWLLALDALLDDAAAGRPVRLPRPGAGDLPRRRGRGPRAAGVPARHELPQRAADPRRHPAVRRGGAVEPRAPRGRPPTRADRGRDRRRDHRSPAPTAPPAASRRRRRALGHRRAERRLPGGLGRLAPAHVRQRGPLERPGGRRRPHAGPRLATSSRSRRTTRSCATRSAASRASSARSSCSSSSSPDDKRLDQMLYVGASRARQHLAVIGSAAVLERLR